MENQASPSESVLVAHFEKNKKEEVRVSLDTFHGRKLINIRVYFKDDDGTMKPGRQGIALAVERYKDFAGAIVEVGQHLNAQGLL